MNKTTDKTTAGAGIRVWGFRSSDYPMLPIKRGCAALGWEKIGDLSKLPRDREGFKRVYAKAYADEKPTDAHVNTNTTQILAFAWEAKVGDVIVYPYKKDVRIGRITSDYRHAPDWEEAYRHVRDVEWLYETERGSFTAGAQNSLKALCSFWSIGDGRASVKNEFLKCLDLEDATPAEKSHEEWVYENLYERLGGEGFERFVAAMFRLYGYEVETTARSGDHGIDLVATRTDALWSQRSVVQVKCCRGRSSEAEVQQLAGVLKCGERGVFVSYAGLRDAARKCAAEKGIAVIDGRRVCTLALWNEERLAKDWPQVFAHGA